MNKVQLKRKIEDITNLPTLPQVATHLLKIINDPATSCSDVAFIVGQDVSLSARILRLANSAFYGMPKTVTTVKNAVVILGLKVINTLVLSLTVFDMFPQDRDHQLFDRKAFWRHSLGCGLIAKRLATAMDTFMPFDAEEAFCCGLLHDIGKVVMEQYLHDDFRSALANASKHAIPSFEAEEQALGYTHTDIAEWLTTKWQLPEVLQSAIIGHHLPDTRKEYPDMAFLCCIADALSYDAGLPASSSSSRPAVDERLFTKLHLDTHHVQSAITDIDKDLEKIQGFFGIDSKS